MHIHKKMYIFTITKYETNCTFYTSHVVSGSFSLMRSCLPSVGPV